MNKFKQFISFLKLKYYEISLSMEDFMDNLYGRRLPDLPTNVVHHSQELQNHKLKRAIKKLRKKIYKYDEEKEAYVLKDFVKKKDFDLVSLLHKEKLSTTEKLQVARIQQRILQNPTDNSGTEEKMVKHNVKNAKRYELERKRRELVKQRDQILRSSTREQLNQATTTFNIKKLNNKIQILNLQIKQLKEND